MKAVIIGGGIIGLCSAYYLQKSGWNITVLEKNDFTNNCSFGNAGFIVPSHFTPLASPGIIAQGIQWMFSSKSPFYIRPSLSWPLLKWGFHFIRHANKKNVERGAPHLIDLNLFSLSLYKNLASLPDFNFSLQQKGILVYYKTEKAGEEESHLAAKGRSFGLDVEILQKDQVQQLEPGIELDILGASYYRCDAHLYPNQFMTQLKEVISRAGVTMESFSAVTSMQKLNGTIKSVRTTGKVFEADLFVVAGGSWLPEISKMAGLSVPLMSGKGYSYTEKNPTIKLNIPAILCEARVAITPMNGHMRYGGTMEIGSVNEQINLRRVQGIMESIPKYFPGMRLPMPEKEKIWYGFRPCSPDGLPFIGFGRGLKNLIIAGGHSMMGLSQGPATGQIVSELANGTALSLKIDAFDPGRFSNR